ncbi:MAG TPA: flagellar biosynthetic protein FliO [Solirubrobacteraceae bacterium]|jgi:flagellar protein FliO/FliZ
MTKLIPFSRAAATVAALLGPCLLALALPATALAGSAASSENTALHLGTQSPGVHTSGGGASLVRTIVGLAIVLAVIWGLSWILRQVKQGREPQVSSSGLQSVAALTLSSGRSVHLVKAGSEYVLLGSAEHGVVPIHRYSEDEAREAGLVPLDDEPPRKRRPALLAPRTQDPAAKPDPLAFTGAREQHTSSRPPTTGSPRHDPMSMATPGADLVGRLREWTVRR